MALPTDSVQLTDLATSTFSRRLPGTVDLVFKSRPYFIRLTTRNKIVFDGGRDIRQRIRYAKMGGGSYRGLDTLEVTEKETSTEMVFDWAQHYVPVTTSMTTLLKNRGISQIVDLLEDYYDNAEMTLADRLGGQLYGDGTGNGGKDLLGLKAAFDDGTNYNYGGITRDTSDVGTAAKGVLDTTGGATTLSTMNSQFGATVIGMEKPDLITTTQSIWNKIWDRVQPSDRRPYGEDLARIGMQSISFNGADIVVDDAVASGEILYNNMKWIKLVVHEARPPALEGPFFTPNQDSRTWHLFWMGQLVVQAPRLNSRATGMT